MMMGSIILENVSYGVQGLSTMCCARDLPHKCGGIEGSAAQHPILPAYMVSGPAQIPQILPASATTASDNLRSRYRLKILKRLALSPQWPTKALTNKTDRQPRLSPSRECLNVHRAPRYHIPLETIRDATAVRRLKRDDIIGKPKKIKGAPTRGLSPVERKNRDHAIVRNNAKSRSPQRQPSAPYVDLTQKIAAGVALHQADNEQPLNAEVPASRPGWKRQLLPKRADSQGVANQLFQQGKPQPYDAELPWNHQQLSVSKLYRSSCGNNDPYENIRPLGVGGNGRCFLLRRRGDNQLVACKVIFSGIDPQLRALADEPGHDPLHRKTRRQVKKKISRALKEVRIFRSLSPHDRIIQIYGEPEAIDNKFQIYMEYCYGGDLFGVIQRYGVKMRLVPESFIWHTFLQLAQGMAYMHQGYDYRTPQAALPQDWVPIIHADFKPENILLRPSRSHPLGYPDLVITDFGASETVPGNDGFPRGTINYQPPEVPEWSKEADIWALGATIHALALNNKTPCIKAPGHWVEAQMKERWLDPNNPGYVVEGDAKRSMIRQAWYMQPCTRKPEPLLLYSATLESCMNDCLAWDKHQRPTAYDIMTDIEWELETDVAGWEPDKELLDGPWSSHNRQKTCVQ